jgi:putative NADH-flavin reductase
MRLILFGATGQTGRRILARALEAGHEVTAFVRDPGALGLRHPRLKVARGDVTDPAAVEAHLPGHDAALAALGPTRGGALSVNSLSAENITRAMERAGVRRLVSLGSGLAVEDTGLIGGLVRALFLKKAAAEKRREEAIIRASALEWIIVRPPRLTNGRARGAYRVEVERMPPSPGISISRDDVADFMLAQLKDHRYVRTAPSIAY